MKKVIALISTLFFTCANLSAVSVGDTANYANNAARTTFIINNATGSLKVVEHRTSGEFGPGFVVRLTYSLDVKIRGPQTGDMGIFVPEAVFSQGFYDELKNSSMNFGVFNAEYLDQGSAKDSSGRQYDNCSMVKASSIDHDFAGAKNQAKVVWFKPEGTIKSVKNMEIKLKSCAGAPILGAVEIDVTGVTNFGMPFKAGLDLVP